MDFVWNEVQAEQIRAENARALQQQAEALDQAAGRFNHRANELEQQADTIEAGLPIMKTIETTHYYTDEDGYESTYTTTEQVVNQSATSEAESQIRELRAQAQELRCVANEFVRAAAELRDAIRESNRLFEQMRAEAQETDRRHTHKLRGTIQDIHAYTRRMEEMRDGIGGTLNDESVSALDRIKNMMLQGTLLSREMAAQLAGTSPYIAYDGDPVNMSTGNFVYSKEDISIPGHFPLHFSRFYNAIDSTNSVLGVNWTHNFNIALYSDENFAHITFADGRVITFENTGDGNYITQLDSRHSLVKNADSWMMVSGYNEIYSFNDVGQLQSISDTNGNKTAFTHTNGLLACVSTPSGNLNFTYNQNNHIIAITDHTNRAVTFEYEENHLSRVTHATGAVYQYHYDSKGRIKEVTNPLGITAINNKYDTNSRAARQLLPDGGIMEYRYDDKNKTTTYINQKGIPKVYTRDENYRTIKISHPDGSFETFAYNDANRCTSRTDRNKNRWQYAYDNFGNTIKVIDPLGNTSVIEYNTFNKPTTIIAPNRGIVTNTYDTRGNLTAIADSIGRQTCFASDTQGKVTKVTLPDGSNNQLGYDHRGNITSITNSVGITTKYEYDSLNRVIKSTDGNGATTTYTYNTRGDISTVTDALGSIYTYEYNLIGKVTKVTGPTGSCVQYKYNNTGKLEEIIDPQGGTTQLAYDKVWNVTAITDPLGNTICYQYGQDNRITKTTDQEGNATSYLHDHNGNIVSVTTPLGAETIILYDALNRQKQVIEPDHSTTSIEYDSMGNVVQVTDALGNVTKREYDLANQLIKVTDPLGNATSMTYTALGKVEHITNTLGGQYTYAYYPGGLLKSVSLPSGEMESYQYDNNGNVKTVTNALGHVTTLEYDVLNRVVQTTNALGYSKQFQYDAMGNMTHITDENGNITRYKYSLLGDVVEVIDPTGHSTEYSYNAMQQLTELKQYNSLGWSFAAQTARPCDRGEPQVTTYERNKKGEVISVTSPLGNVVKYTYDPMGKVTSKVDEDELETLYSYNLVNQLSKISYADGKTVELSYSPLKQLTEMRDWLGTTSIELDPLGRATKVTDHSGNEVGYVYNFLGQREKLTYPDGNEVRYEYNLSGNISKVVASTISGFDTMTYAYDPLGRISERILPDNTTTKYEFNPLGALSGLTHSNNSGLLDRFTYSYDPVGNITQIEKYRTGIDSDNGVFKYTYDPLNRLTEAIKGDGSSKQYMYDPLGNRVASMQNQHGITTETRHSFNARNQLMQTVDGESITDYTYDKRGNLTQTTQNGQLQTAFTFDATNMMVGAHHRVAWASSSPTGERPAPTKGDATYTYNGFRNRVAKLESLHNTQTAVPTPAEEVRYVLDMTLPYDNLLMTQHSDVQHPTIPGSIQSPQTQSFVWGNSLLSATGATQEQNFHYLQDHLGSPIRLLGNDNLNAPISHDEFGVLEVVTTTPQGQHNPFGFTGYQRDNISGLHYAQARYYNPTVARFTAQDAVRDGANWYAYCNANPLGFVDRNGLWPDNVHRCRTTEWAIEMGFDEDFARALGRATYGADSLLGGYNFFPGFIPIIGGNQGVHFNTNSYGDSRDDIARDYVQKAIYAWNNASVEYARTLAEISRIDYLNNPHLKLGVTMQRFNAEQAYTHRTLAMHYLSIALHAQQDIEAHGDIAEGPGGIFGHARATIYNNRIVRHLAVALNPLAAPLLFLPTLPDPDSYNYKWGDDTKTWLVPFDGHPDDNPRIIDTRDLTSRLLWDFARGIEIQDQITRLHFYDSISDNNK